MTHTFHASINVQLSNECHEREKVIVKIKFFLRKYFEHPTLLVPKQLQGAGQHYGGNAFRVALT